MKLIVAVDKNWGIGRNNSLLFNLPKDLMHFKEITYGKTVIMGDKTFLSLPGSKPLPGRRNIVLSLDKDFYHPGIEILHSFEELFNLIDINSPDNYVIGGATIYNSLLEYCDELFITKVDADGKADTFIKNIDLHPDYILSEISDSYYENGLRFNFTRYTRKIHM